MFWRNGWKRAVFSSLVSRAAPALVRLVGTGTLRILNYHRINHASPDFLLDDEVISASPELFDEEMQFCARHFDVISFADVEAALDGGPRLPQRSLIITFDDGYEDNYRYAYPILRSHRLPATFCIAVDHVGTDRLFWWDQVACAVKTYADTRLTLDVGADRLTFEVPTPASRRTAVKRILSAIKRVPNARRIEAVERLIALAPPGAWSGIGRQSMTWDEIRQLVAGGMTIASHTMSHPVLAQLEEADALKYEVEASKAILEQETGAAVRVFSYPVGGVTAVNDRVVAAVKAAGYRFAVSYVSGFNSMGAQLDMHGMRRLDVDGLNAREFKTQLAVAV